MNRRKRDGFEQLMYNLLVILLIGTIALAISMSWSIYKTARGACSSFKSYRLKNIPVRCQGYWKNIINNTKI